MSFRASLLPTSVDAPPEADLGMATRLGLGTGAHNQAQHKATAEKGEKHDFHGVNLLSRPVGQLLHPQSR